jgi:signal transduction histidine kinase
VTPSAYLWAFLAVLVASAATSFIHPWMGPSVSLMFFPAIVLAAVYGGYGPALFATVLSTFSLAFFFVPPRYSLDLGPDDWIRLIVFAAVAVATASLSAARRRAQDAQRRALDELHAALTTLRKVSGWPTFVGAGLGAGSHRLLAHAAAVVGCSRALASWETDDEPWIYVADSSSTSDTLTHIAPDESSSLVGGEALRGATLACEGPRGERADASAPFELEHLAGRVFFVGVPSSGPDLIPLAEVVAREVGNSLEHLYVHHRLQQVAVREDRIRVARDLHDGVLQSLTGIRFQLQALADRPAQAAEVGDHLLAIERAIANEQRELRRFIEDLKPVARRPVEQGGVARTLGELRDRLGAEWQTPITVRITPADLGLRPEVEEGVRLLVREAAINALKHAHPSRVSVEVDAGDDGALRLVIANDGRGFPFRGRLDYDALLASSAAPVSLCERVKELAGTIVIESRVTGSRVEITLPLTGAAS